MSHPSHPASPDRQAFSKAAHIAMQQTYSAVATLRYEVGSIEPWWWQSTGKTTAEWNAACLAKHRLTFCPLPIGNNLTCGNLVTDNGDATGVCHHNDGRVSSGDHQLIRTSTGWRDKF